METRTAVSKAIEDAVAAKEMKVSQEAAVSLVAPADVYEVLQRYGTDFLLEAFIVSSLELTQGEELAAHISRTDKPKCPRCWNYRDLSTNEAHPHVCERCASVLDELGFEEAE